MTAKQKESLPSICGLCRKAIRYGRGNKKALAQGLPVDANTHDLDAKSEMHYAHVSGSSRSRQQFAALSQDAWERMRVNNPKGSWTCCYECHEVLMHNIIVGENELDLLAEFFRGKSFEERVILLNNIFTTGLRVIASTARY